MSFALNGPAPWYATGGPGLWYATRATGLVSLLLLTGTMLLGIATAGRFASENWLCAQCLPASLVMKKP